ncbi:MAG: regulatory protein RecX [Chloroflexi bacterium]|nr:regulatory protein RecX [Chloroflexota bacterium]
MPRSRRLRPPVPTSVLETDVSQAVQRGLALIAQRPRTSADLRDRLGDRFEPGAADAALVRLTELGYVDDTAWASAYVARTRSSERSARMLRAELREHGVAPETAEEALHAHDDDEAAITAARRLARGRAPDERARRLHGALARRGFGFDVIERALSRLAEEHASAA